MLTPDTFIDAFQGAKRQFTNQFITDATFNKAANAYIDAQTAFAKTLTKNTLDITAYSADTVTKFFFPKEEKVSKAKVTVVSKDEATA